MEEVTKCSYVDCCPDSCSTDREQMLHELPVSDTGLCVKWLINSGHEDLINRDFFTLRSMKFFICNNHFSDDCYLSKGTLKDSAVPFPYWHTILVCSTTTQVDCRRKEEQGKHEVHEREEKNRQRQINGRTVPLGTQHPLPLASESSTTRSSAEVVHRTDDLNDSSAVASDNLQWCRTCATQRYNLISMTTKMKSTEMSLLSKLKLLIEIDDEDALPTKMCDECVAKLEQSFKFFQQIYVADNALRQLFSETQSAVVGRRGLSPPTKENWRNEAARLEQHVPSPLSDTTQVKNDNGFDSNSQLAAHGPGDLEGIELCASVRQTRQTRAADVPRGRRLVGRPRGSSSRWSRSTRGSRVSRMSRASRGTRGTRGTRGGWRSRAASSVPRAHHSDRGSSSTVDDRPTPDNEISDPALSSEQSRKRPRRISVSTEDKKTREKPLETAAITKTAETALATSLQIVNEDSQGTSVFSLLTDTCRSDETLDWADVLAVMSREGGHSDLDRAEETVPHLCCESLSSVSSLASSQVPTQSPALLSLPPVPPLSLPSSMSNSEFHHPSFTCDCCGKSVDSKALLATHIANAGCLLPKKQISSDTEDNSVKPTASNAAAPAAASMLDGSSPAYNSQSSGFVEQESYEKGSIEGFLNTEKKIATDSEIKFSTDVLDSQNVPRNASRNSPFRMDSSPIPVEGTTADPYNLSDKLESGTSVTRRSPDEAMSDDGLDRTKRLKTSIGGG